MILTALYDRATEAHGQVMTTKTRAEALRSFAAECKKPSSPIHQHASDYELYLIGEYDEVSGAIQPMRERIARAEDHKGE